MKKSENVWEGEKFEEVWDFIKENPLIMGVPISESKGIDLLTVLRDIYQASKVSSQQAQTLLTVLAHVLVAAAQGDGEQVVEEVIVSSAMIDIDTSLKEILNEGH